MFFKSLIVACLVAIVCVGCSTAEDDKALRDSALSLVETIRTSPGVPCQDPKLEAERSAARTKELHAVDTFENVARNEPLSLKDMHTALDVLTSASKKFLDVQDECLIGSLQPI